MKKFNSYIREYIAKNFYGGDSNEGRKQTRIVLKGLPFDVGKDFIEELLEVGGLSINGKIIPSILYDRQLEDGVKPISTFGGICGKDYVLNLRNNSNLDEYLVILSEGTLLDKSNSSSLQAIGINEDVEKDDWVDQEFIDYLLKNSLANKRISPSDIQFNDIKNTLRSFSHISSINKSKNFNWKILKSISENDFVNDLKSLSCLLGFINYPDNESLDFDKSYKCFQKIAFSFENAGINTTFRSWLEKEMPEVIEDSLKHFKNHIASISAPFQFIECPFYFYSSLNWEEGFDHWLRLDTDVWQEIIEEDEPPSVQGKIEVVNALFNNHLPCPVVLDEVLLKIIFANHTDTDFEVESKKGNKFELLDTIEKELRNGTVICKDTPLDHKNFYTYRIKKRGSKEITQKVISLAHYEPGFVFDVIQLQKVSKLTFKKDNRSNNKIWISNGILSNSGSHEFKFYWDLKRFRLAECSVRFKEEHTSKMNINNFENGVGSFVFDIEESITIEVKLVNLKDQYLHIIKITLVVSDDDPTGVKNVIEKLIHQNISSKGINEKISVYQTWSKLHQLQQWILENDINPGYPLILGADYKTNFSRPDWEKLALISSGELNVDFRPLNDVFIVPEKVKWLRTEIIKILLKSDLNNSENANQLLEYQELYNPSIAPNLSVIVKSYLEEYFIWLKENPKIASWYELVAISDVDENLIINHDPFAILLSPIHPIRIAWQFQAQNYLYESLVKSIPCPAAGVIQSMQFPDSLSLSYFSNYNEDSSNIFLSIETESVTWGVLWNSTKLDLLKNKKFSSFFDDDFGLEIEGLDSGLSSSQIEQSLSDIFKIKSGQNAVNVEVYSESSDTELFNKGVEKWVSNNLGEDKFESNKRIERDIWYSSGSKKLNIFDSRPIELQPTAEALIGITTDSGYSVKWFDKSIRNKIENLDLSIISHLKNQSSDLISGENSAVLFNGCISRERIRNSRLNNLSKLSFFETRTVLDKDYCHSKGDDIASQMADILVFLENQVNKKNKGHLSTIPNLKSMIGKLETSDYCAVSSSVVDPSAFFDSSGNYFLWDYDLPSYSSKNPSKSGFFLIAKNSEFLIESVRKSLKNIPGMGNTSTIQINEILKEISGRGIPTLKTLASGGSNANGEVGMLTAMNLLQNYNIDDESFQFVPLKEGDITTIFIPIDPFTKQYNSLCKSMKIDERRPDLLAFSFSLKDNVIEGMKLTAVEVKYRNSPMELRGLEAALDQCQNFYRFYDKLMEYSLKSVIWDNARCKLFSEMISFGFATYGRKIKQAEDSEEWAKIQSKLIACLNDYSKIQVNNEGRLLVISNYALTEFDIINSKFGYNILKISFEDAKDILKRNDQSKFNFLGAKVGNWGFLFDANQKFNQIEGSDLPKKTDGLIDLIGTEKITSPEDFENTDPVKAKTQIDHSIKEFENEGILFSVGSQEGALSSIPYKFHPSNTNLNQLNIGIVGDLGTGKTQLIKALLYNITKDPKQNRGEAPKFLIMDTKRDYDGSGDKESDMNLVKSMNARVVKPYNLPINLFDIRNSIDDNPAFTKAEFFIDILKKIYGGIGPSQENNILRAVIEAFEIKGYKPFLGNYKEFRSPTISDIFTKYAEIIDGKFDTPYSIMNRLVLNSFFESDSTKTVSFQEFFNQSIVLSLGGVASNGSLLKMIMIFFLNMYREYMLSVKKYDFISKDTYQLRKIDSYLLIDEANLIMEYELPVLEDLLLKGREFGIGILLSSQYLSHFKKSGTDYMQPLLTWFVHKVPNISIKELQSLGLTNVDENTVRKIKSFDKHECLYKGLNAPGVIIKGVPHYILDRSNP